MFGPVVQNNSNNCETSREAVDVFFFFINISHPKGVGVQGL